MSSSGEKEGNSGGAIQKIASSATDALVESVSSLAGSALDEGAKRLNDFSLDVFRENLDRMVKERSIVGAAEVENLPDELTMSPMIMAMLEACFLSLGGHGGEGATWVVCAPPDQGKTLAAQFLIHGDHTMRPNRSLKIDATNMTNFANDFAQYTQCSAAESFLSQLLCEALSDTAPGFDNESRVARMTAAAKNMAGKFLCVPGKSTALGELMKMKRASKHKVLALETEGVDPAPILIIDEFYCDTTENQDFVRTLLRDAAAKGIVVFIMTRDRSWASKLIKLNGGVKCKPLHVNVDNAGYDGSQRFTGEPLWNDFYWPVERLRKLVLPTCNKYGILPETAIPEGSKLTPGEAKKTVMKLRLKALLNH